MVVAARLTWARVVSGFRCWPEPVAQDHDTEAEIADIRSLTNDKVSYRELLYQLSYSGLVRARLGERLASGR